MLGEVSFVNPISSIIHQLHEKGFELNDLAQTGETTVDIEFVKQMLDGAIFFLQTHEKLGNGFSGYDKEGNPKFTNRTL